MGQNSWVAEGGLSRTPTALDVLYTHESYTMVHIMPLGFAGGMKDMSPVLTQESRVPRAPLPHA